MSGRAIGIFFAFLIGIPIAQVVVDRELGIRRLEIWNGHFERHHIATSKRHRSSGPSPQPHRTQRNA